MALTSYTDDSFTEEAATMSVYINPSSYSRTYEIVYNDTQAQGSSSGSPEYNKTLADKVKFQLVFDGTGVVPSPTPGASSSSDNGISDQIEEFLNLAFDFDGEIHSPNFIRIAWGDLIFDCRLSNLNIVYSLFRPDGTPLRAKADVTFVEYQNQQTIAKTEAKKSPDLTRVVTVKGGDTLPLLCFQIYGSSTYYAQIAKENRLGGFRDLVPGQQLLFPPLGEKRS